MLIRQEQKVRSFGFRRMDQSAEVYLQRAKEYEALAADAETDILKRTYYELARGYLTLAQYAPKAQAKRAGG